MMGVRKWVWVLSSATLPGLAGFDDVRGPPKCESVASCQSEVAYSSVLAPSSKARSP